MRPAIILGLSFLVLPAAQAQTKPDLTAVLKKVSEIYKAVTQYEFISEGTCSGDQPRTGETFHMLFAFRAPNKYRVQSSAACRKPGEPDPDDALRIDDGANLWAYYAKANQYISIPANLFGDKQAASIGQATLSRYSGIADVADQVKFVREEALSFGASKADCYVVLVPKRGNLAAETWWIDKASYHVVRIDNDESSIVFTTVKLNEPLPDNLFKFTPPPGAKPAQ